jgi:hypothetical protein
LARRSLCAGVALAVLALLAAGCGGSGSDRLTLEEFTTQADAICAEYDEKLNALDGSDSPAEAAVVVRKGMEIAGEQLDELNALSPPEEVEDAFSDAMAILQQELDLFEEFAAALESNDETRANELFNTLEELDTRADARAQEIGLTQCGSAS